MSYDFAGYKKDAVKRPSAKAWSNWAKFEKVGDMVQGYIRDVFYRKAEGLYKDARGITLEQQDGTLINVSIKRLDFVLADTDKLRLGDPLTVVLEELRANTGKNATKIFGYYGVNTPETKDNKTVAELDAIDRGNGGQSGTDVERANSAAADAEVEDMARSAGAALDSTPKA